MPSSLDRIKSAAQRQQNNQGPNAHRIMQETHETFQYGRTWVRAVQDGDTLGIGHLRAFQGKGMLAAFKEWYAKSWTEWKSSIKPLARLDKIPARQQEEAEEEYEQRLAQEEAGAGEIALKAREILEIINAFEADPEIAQTLQEVFETLARPARITLSPSGLNALLNEQLIRGNVREFPTQPMSGKSFPWERKYVSPANTATARNLVFPWLFQAFKRVSAQLNFEERVTQRLGPLMELATMDNNPESQNLNRLLSGTKEIGSMVVFNDKSQTMDPATGNFVDAGLLAVLLDRPTPDSNLILRAVQADVAFPETMAENDYELPQLNVLSDVTRLGEIEIQFVLNGQNGNVSREERNAILRIQSLLKSWLHREGRYQMALLPPGETKPTKRKRTRSH
jgi:hypothetical protein